MKSIHGRLLATLLPGLLLVLAAGGTAVYWIARTALLGQLDAALRARAEALAALVTYDDGRLDFEFDGGGEPISEGWFEFRTPAGEVLRRSRDLDASLRVTADPAGGFSFGDVALPGDRAGRAAELAFRPRLDDEYRGAASAPDPGTVVVVTAIDRGPTDRALAVLLGTLIGVGAAAAAAAGLLVTIGVRWGLRPLSRLRRRLGGVGGGRLTTRLDGAGAPRELQPVYRELNAMLDRVQRTLRRERDFVDAAAHELRTPLAELRAAAEVALRWPDEKRAVESLGELLSIGREMEQLVESLLLISRGGRPGGNGAVSEVAAGSIVRRCLERASAARGAPPPRVTVAVDDDVPLAAPPEGLAIIFGNLIDNALRYTPADGCVAIRAEPGPHGRAALVVENGPVELDESDLARLFEPFWRHDGARSDRAHHGLGLAVARRVAEAVGLTVEARLSGDRLRLRVSVAREAGPDG